MDDSEPGAGALVRLTITAVVAQGFAGKTLTNTATAAVLERQEDDPSNNSGTASILALPVEIISLNPSSLTPGINVTANQLTTLCTNIRSNEITMAPESIHLHQEGSSTVSVEELNADRGV